MQDSEAVKEVAGGGNFLSSVAMEGEVGETEILTGLLRPLYGHLVLGHLGYILGALALTSLTISSSLLFSKARKPLVQLLA